MAETGQTPIQNPVTHTEKTNWLLLLLAGMIILVIGIGVGLMLGKYSPKPKQISSYEDCVKANGNQITLMFPGTCTTRDGRQFTQPLTDEEKKNLQPPADPTANWKIYINEAHNYSLKYPQTWIVNAVDADLDKNSELIIFDNGYKITIWSNLIGIGGLIRKVPYELVTVSGLSLYKRELGDNLVEKTSTIEIADRPDSPTFIHGGKTYDISFDYPSSAKNTNELKSHLEIFNQLLSTFKFDDQNTGDTTNWKTYSNSRYNFELKYPKEWEGPMKISGTNIQGQASFQGTEGAIILTWGGGFGGGLCSQKVQIIQTGMGDMGFCATHENDGSKTLKTANEGPVPQNAQYINVQFTINPPVQENEQILNQIFSTFKFLGQNMAQ